MNRCTLHSPIFWRLLIMMSVVWSPSLPYPTQASVDTVDALQIEITKKGASKQVVMSQGAKEWFMLIDVTSDNAVILRQEKDHDRYLVDESETHDRPMTAEEVDAAITDYVNSVKTRMGKK
jgi:hypothetical protein